VAIYRCEFKIISRSSGHRACAAAAYRAGEKIMDERYGAAHDYTRKTGVAASFILAPQNAPDWMSNRTELWNAVEAVERRKDAQLCREVLLSLPHEMTDEQREALVRQFVHDQFVSRGMVADVNIHTHSPSGDERNDHAHILLTTRTLTASSFGPKERSWNSRDFVHETREAWADAQNRSFEQLGLDCRVDHRSLADQGIDREPEPKLGSHATEAIRNGEPETADRVVQHHDEVMDRNAERERLTNEREVIDLALARLDKTRGERDANEFAGLAVIHAQQMRNIQAAQASSLYALKREQMTDLRTAVRAARADHALFRKELTPSFLQRMGEIVMLKGREMRERRNDALREFKSTQDSRLNALRAQQRRELAALKDHHASALDRLRDVQSDERDEIALRQEQRFEREQALLRAKQAGGTSRAEDVLLARPDIASPALPYQEPPSAPELPTEELTEPREGLSGVWDAHALPDSAPDAPDTTDGGEERGDGSRGDSGGTRAGGSAAEPPAPLTDSKGDARHEKPRDADEVLTPSASETVRSAQAARPVSDDKGERKKTGLFAERKADQPSPKQDKPEAKATPEKTPHFLDPDYTGPSKKDLDRADQMDKAIRQHKARQARQRAAERRRLEREKDRDGPER
jgi:hypothetical protein